MSKRIAIGPDQIQQGNKIECHIAGACATYLDTNREWRISDNTVLQHSPSPTDATTGREIWTNRPLTVGVNTYGARQDLVTIRESSSLGKHTEWSITPIDSHSLRRKTQENTTEYDLDEQVVQATSNNTTRIFTPYTGQERISYEIVAPPAGEIRNENGQINAYRDDFYLFTIAEPTIYDAERNLITDAEGLPVRCYSIRLETVSAEEGVYIVHKELCDDVPDGVAWVDVEVTNYTGSVLWRAAYETFSALRNATSATSRSVLSSSTNTPYVQVQRTQSAAGNIYRALLHFNTSGLSGVVDSVAFFMRYINSNPYSFATLGISQGTSDPTTAVLSNYSAWGTNYVGGVDFNTISSVALPVDVIGNNPVNSDYTSLMLREYAHDYANISPAIGEAFRAVYYPGAYLQVTIDPGHTGAFKPAEIVGSIPSEGGVVQIDFTGSNAVGLDIANNLSDTSGATDIHFRTVDDGGNPDELIPFQRLSASGSGSTFAYSAKLDMPAGVTDFAVCYGPNNPPSADYVDFSSTVSGDPENPTETESGEGYWRFSAKLLISSSWRILSRIVKEASWNLLAAITKSSNWSRQATPIEYSSGWKGPNISGDASKSFESLKINNYTFKVYSNNKFDFKVSKNFNLGD